MWTDRQLAEVVRDAPATVDEALRVIQHDGTSPVDLRSVTATARFLGVDHATYLVDQLIERALRDRFEHALLARGLAPPTQQVTADDLVVEDDTVTGERLDFDGLDGFTARARAFRCRVKVGNTITGSGCLVGPSLVLTAWHVVQPPNQGGAKPAESRVSVVLSDGIAHEAVMPPSWGSECGAREWERAPRADDEVTDRHDVALLALRSPAARYLGFAPLPADPPETASGSTVFVLDFPNGEDKGLGHGTAGKFRNLTARLYHSAGTGPGSSGGACFDARFELLGLHQGTASVVRHGQKVDGGRFVPVRLFLDDVGKRVAENIAPSTIWRLDGRSDKLVIGRDLFVRAVAAAGKPDSRVRGIRVKRRRPAEGDERGLGYSQHILSELLMRRGDANVVVSVPLDESLADLVDDIAWRVEAAGVHLAPQAAPGPDGPAAAEGAAHLRAERLVRAVDQAAAAAGRTVWFYVDQPSVDLTETARLQLEAFVAECLRTARIRLVVAGLEMVQLAGLEFSSPEAADPHGPVGLVVEYVGGFTREDVLDCVAAAALELTGDVDPDEIGVVVSVALAQGTPFNGEYPERDLAGVLVVLQNFLLDLARRAGARG